LFFFFQQKTAYEIRLSLVGSEMCIRDRGGRERTYLKSLFLDLVFDALSILFFLGLLFVIFYYQQWYLAVFLIITPIHLFRMLTTPLELIKTHPRNKIIARIQEKKRRGIKIPED